MTASCLTTSAVRGLLRPASARPSASAGALIGRLTPSPAQVQLIKRRGVGEHLDCCDLVLSDRKAEHHPCLTTRRPYQAGLPIDQGEPRGTGSSSKGLRDSS